MVRHKQMMMRLVEMGVDAADLRAPMNLYWGKNCSENRNEKSE